MGTSNALGIEDRLSFPVETRNVACSAVVEGNRPSFRRGDKVEVHFGKNRARFRVSWVGEAGTKQEGHVGLQSLTSNRYVWHLALGADQSVKHGNDKYPKLRLCPL
jgi:hypothetical protein